MGDRTPYNKAITSLDLAESGPDPGNSPFSSTRRLLLLQSIFNDFDQTLIFFQCWLHCPPKSIIVGPLLSPLSCAGNYRIIHAVQFIAKFYDIFSLFLKLPEFIIPRNR